MSAVVLLQRNTDSLQQVEEYVRGCSTSTNTDSFQQVEKYARGVEGYLYFVEVEQPLT
jgi:hypothetical protein